MSDDLADRLRHSIEALGEQGVGSNVSMSYAFACDLLNAISGLPPTAATDARAVVADIDWLENFGLSLNCTVTENDRIRRVVKFARAKVSEIIAALPAQEALPIPIWDVREVEDCGHRGMKGYEVLLPDGTWTDVAAHNPEDAIATANLDWRAALPKAGEVEPDAFLIKRPSGKGFVTTVDKPLTDDEKERGWTAIREQLAQLKSQRDALDAEIKLMEKAISKAAYDACMQEQYVRFNDHRLAEGKRQLSASEYASGVMVDDPEKDAQ